MQNLILKVQKLDILQKGRVWEVFRFQDQMTPRQEAKTEITPRPEAKRENMLKNHGRLLEERSARDSIPDTWSDQHSVARNFFPEDNQNSWHKSKIGSFMLPVLSRHF